MQPNETTTTPVLAAPPLTAIVGAIIAVGVVQLVLLTISAVPLVVCLMRRQKRTKGEIIGRVDYVYVRLCLLACIRVYLTLLDVCTHKATYFSHVIKKLTHAQIIPFGVLFCTCLYINIGCLGCCYVVPFGSPR